MSSVARQPRQTLVRELAKALLNRGLRPWFDEWDLRAGRSWQDTLEGALAETGSVAVLIGGNGIGPWQILEQEAFLRAATLRGLPIVPVLLPNAPESPDLPLFLKERVWVDFRGGLSNEGLNQLSWGITGTRPAPVDIASESDDSFDVFFCFRDSDRPAVQRFAENLREAGASMLGPMIGPSHPTNHGGDYCRTNLIRLDPLAVFAANDGGPWDNDEVESFIWELIENEQLVIPVILPNARREPTFPVYLRRKVPHDFPRHYQTLPVELASRLSAHRTRERRLHND